MTRIPTIRALAAAGLLAVTATAGLLLAPRTTAAFVPAGAPAAVETPAVPVWYDRHGRWHPDARPRPRRAREVVRIQRPGPDWCYYRGSRPRNGWRC